MSDFRLRSKAFRCLCPTYPGFENVELFMHWKIGHLTVARQCCIFCSNSGSAIDVLSTNIPEIFRDVMDFSERASSGVITLTWCEGERPSIDDRYPGPLFSLEYDYPFPENPVLDKFNICKLKKGDTVEFVDRGQKFTVKSNHKRDRKVFLITPQNRTEVFPYNMFYKSGYTFKVILPCYERRKSWAKRPLLDDYLERSDCENWDWEIIYNLMVYGVIKEIRLVKVSQNYVEKCEKIASEMQAAIMSCPLDKIAEKYNEIFKIVAYFIWKKRETEERFKNSHRIVFQKYQRNRELENLKRSFEAFFRRSLSLDETVFQSLRKRDKIRATVSIMKRKIRSRTRSPFQRSSF